MAFAVDASTGLRDHPSPVYPCGMASKIILAWTVDIANTPIGATQAAARLAAIDLYENDVTDPVLGQLFGLTVDDDATTNDATSATRTLTLNMDNSTNGQAPPPFPCHPRTSTPPELPYPLRRAVTLPGSFFVTNGSASVATAVTQLPSIEAGDTVQFLSQKGVVYTVLAVPDSTTLTLTTPFTGTSGNTGAFKEVVAPIALDRLAVYSTSDLDTDGVSTTPAIPAGTGAQTVELTYNDSTGAGPFAASASLTGKRPAGFTFDDPSSVDVAEILTFVVDNVGSFANSVGQITLVELSDDLPAIPSNATPLDFVRLTDEAQLLIEQAVAYMTPSYFAIAQQSTSRPQLEGDFLLTTGSTNVPTSEDQTSVLSQDDVIQFAEQMTLNSPFGTTDVLYTIAAVSPGYITLTTPFTGVDNNNTGTNNAGTNSNMGTMGNLGAEVQKKRSGAFFAGAAAPPSNDQLSGPLAQFVALETASPPPNPPGAPATVPAPTFLSGLFTRTLSMGLKGIPITSATITFS